MPILVTGATGLVGNNVVRCLLERGATVRVLARQSSDPRPIAGLDVDVRYGDIRDAGAVHVAASGCQAVVHSAAHVHIGWTGLELARAVNVEGTRNVAEAARAAGARMIHVSSVDALGEGTADTPVDEQTPYEPRTPCPYAITKREAELVVLELAEDDLDAVIVNPTYMLGPWDWKPSSGKLLLSIARFRWCFAPRGVNDFTSVIDVAEAIVEAIEHGKRKERYILSGERRSYLSAFQTIAEACGKFRAFFSVGPSLMYPGAWIGDLTAFLTGREGECNSATIGLIRDRHFFSHEKATRELNYQPRELRDAAEEAWLWFREHGYARSYFGRPLVPEG